MYRIIVGEKGNERREGFDDEDMCSECGYCDEHCQCEKEGE